MTENSINVPFSMPVNVHRLSKKGSVLNYDAPEDIRAAIASMYGLLVVESFQANATIAPWRKNGVKIVGEVRAIIIQPCAITLDPLDAEVLEPIEGLYVPEGSKLALPKLDGEGEIIIDPDGPDLPETFTGDTLDLAEIWMEFFALGLDPFAHIEGATLPDAATKDSDLEAESSPFAALAALKKH